MNVISTDMDITSEMKKDAETKAKEFLGHTEINEAEVSKQMKDYFDNKYQPNWHCVIGKNYFLILHLLMYKKLLKQTHLKIYNNTLLNSY